MKRQIATVCALSSAAAAGAAAPNVLFFLVDDMGWKDAGCYGSSFYETPAIDRLAQDGVRFTQAYCAHPRCGPSRYALMTGKFPARAGNPGRTDLMEASEFTMAEAFKAAGYATFFAGKWHLSEKPEQQPENQGFDINIAGGHTGAPPSYFFPYNEVRQKGHKTEANISGLDSGRPGEYLTDRLTDETVAFLKQHQKNKSGQPFFVYLSHYAVHTPLEAKPEITARYDEKLKQMKLDDPGYIAKDGTTKMHQDNAVYAAMLQSMDESLARILQTLNDLGLAENTIIVFTSDNGGLSNRGATGRQPLATSNLPLRAGKGHCYEGGIRVPLIVKWPGVTKPGMVSDAAVTGTDHYPSLLEMAGLPLKPEQHLDGVSYAGLLKDGPLKRTSPLFWHSPEARPNNTGDINCSVIREGDLKLFDFYGENRVELYNIAADLYETADLSAAQPEQSARLLKEVRAWRKETGAFIKP